MRCQRAGAQRLSATHCAVWLVQRLLHDFYEGMELEGTVEAVYFFHGVKVDIGGQFDGCVFPTLMWASKELTSLLSRMSAAQH